MRLPVPTADATVNALMRAQARLSPSKVALRGDGQSVTYQQLDDQADTVAASLRARGISRGSYVAVIERPQPHQVALLLGIVRSGAAYVALDPKWPPARIQQLLDTARPAAIISSTATDHYADTADTLDPRRLLEADTRMALEEPLDGDLPFCVFSTSGTTGSPKGVVVPHRALLRIAIDVDYAPIDEQTTMLVQAPVGSDVFAFELWVPLINGGACVFIEDPPLTPAGLRAYVMAGVNSIALTTTHLNAIIDEDVSCFAGLRLLATGGERASAKHLARLAEAHPGLPVLHAYGPAESTCFATTYLLQNMDLSNASEVPIGHPVNGTEIYLVEEADQPSGATLREVADPGEVGEIYIGGDGLASHYLGASADDERRFCHRVLRGELRRVYRTGDLAERRDDGFLVFVGRKDRQVKIRGNRVELGDIEATMRRLDGLLNVAVRAMMDADGRVVGFAAYYVSSDGHPRSPTSLRAAASALLPEHMLPVWYVHMAVLPFTRFGKVEYGLLPDPSDEDRAVPIGQDADDGHVPSVYESVVRDVMASVLEKANVTGVDSFASLGGDSLAATRIASRLWAATGIDVSVSEVLAADSARRISRLIEQRAFEGEADVPEVPPSVTWPAPASDAQLRFWLAEVMSESSSTENVVPMVYELHGASLDLSALAEALAPIVEHHFVLRTALCEGASGLEQVVVETPPPSQLLVSTASDRVADIVEETASRIDLEAGLPVAASVATNSGRSYLVIATHHVATDAWSGAILARELSAGYASLCNGLTPEAVTRQSPSYAQYAVWHRRLLERIEARQLRYWQNELVDVAPLPWSQGASTDGLEFQMLRLRTLVTFGALERCARALGRTPYAVALAAYALAIADVARQEDFAIGIAVSGRRHASFDDTIGCFTNTVAVRPRIAPNSDVHAAVESVALHLNDALQNQDVPFNRVVSATNPRRDVTHPIMQAYFEIHAPDKLRLDLGESIHAENVDTDLPGGTVFDLYLELRWRSGDPLDNVGGRLLYRPGVVGSDVAEAVAARFGERLGSLTGAH